MKKLLLKKSVLSWALYDWANSAFATTVMAGFFPVFYSALSSDLNDQDSQFWFNITLAGSSILVAISAPLLGAIADRVGGRKKFLVTFAMFGVLMTAGLAWVHAGMWWVGLLLYGFGTIGFSGANIFTLDKVAVAIDIESLNSNPIIINEILVAQPQVFYEMNKDKVSNLDVLKKNVASYSASDSAAPDDKAASDEAAPGEEMKLIIKKLRFDGGHLSAVSAIVPDKKIEADLPAFQMNNLGQSTGGATSEQIAKQVIDRLVKQAIDVAAKAGVDQLTDELKEKGKAALDEKVGDTLKGLFK